MINDKRIDGDLHFSFLFEEIFRRENMILSNAEYNKTKKRSEDTEVFANPRDSVRIEDEEYERDEHDHDYNFDSDDTSPHKSAEFDPSNTKSLNQNKSNKRSKYPERKKKREAIQKKKIIDSLIRTNLQSCIQPNFVEECDDESKKLVSSTKCNSDSELSFGNSGSFLLRKKSSFGATASEPYTNQSCLNIDTNNNNNDNNNTSNNNNTNYKSSSKSMEQSNLIELVPQTKNSDSLNDVSKEDHDVEDINGIHLKRLWERERYGQKGRRANNQEEKLIV